MTKSIFYRWAASTALLASLSACIATMPGTTEITVPNPTETSTPSGTTIGVPTEGLIDFFSFDSTPNPEKMPNVSLTSDRFGKANGAYHFSGDEAYVQVDFNINPDVHPALSFSAWTRYVPLDVSDPPSRARIISHDNGAYDRSMGIDNRNPNKISSWSIFAGSEGVLGAVPLEAGVWLQLTTVYDQSQSKALFYINGKLVASSDEAKLGEGYDYLYIGGSPGFGEYFQGDIDDVRIYDRALSASEVSALYEGSKP